MIIVNITAAPLFHRVVGEPNQEGPLPRRSLRLVSEANNYGIFGEVSEGATRRREKGIFSTTSSDTNNENGKRVFGA